MADINQFGSAKPVRSGEGTTCAQCEAMLPDWMDHAPDGELTAKDRAAFELHIATCAECSQMLADAQRGAALLEMLRSPRPEPSSALMDRILASTSGLAGPAKSRMSDVIAMPSMALPSSDEATVEIRSVHPANYLLAPDAGAQYLGGAQTGNVLRFRSPSAGRFSLRAITHTMMQPRLAMTAAMAFFSIALTLNLTGVRLNQLSISDLKPSNLRRTFYQADASVVRYYDNLRVVYELESRVQDLKRSNESSETDGAASGAKSSPDSGAEKEKSKQAPRKDVPKASSGTSQRHTPLQKEFRLAEAPDLSHPPRRDALEPAVLTSSFERMTIAGNSLKDEDREGVLA